MPVLGQTAAGGPGTRLIRTTGLTLIHFNFLTLTTMEPHITSLPVGSSFREFSRKIVSVSSQMQTALTATKLQS